MSEKSQNKDQSPKERNKKMRLWKSIDQFGQWANKKRRRKILLGLAITSIILIALASYTANNFEGDGARAVLAAIILLAFVSILTLAASIFLEVTRLSRSRGDAGPTQRRLITLFVLMALVPTIIVAVFSAFTLNFGLENWFSGRVKNVVNVSYETARAYSSEHRTTLERDGQLIYQQLSLQMQSNPALIQNLRVPLTNALQKNSENISHAFIITGDGDIVARGPRSYLFDFEKPAKTDMNNAINGEKVIIEDISNNSFHYLRGLDTRLNYYLYITRPVDGKILSLLDQTEETAKFYRNSEENRQQLLIGYALFFLVVSLVILLLAIWAAIYFAARLTRPISSLVRAVENVSQGDFNTRVIEMDDDDEFGLLSRSFNQMTSDISNSQKALKAAGEASETERMRFNNVLEGVSSGVVGVNAKGEVTFINSAATNLLDYKSRKKIKLLEEVAPEFVEPLEFLKASDEQVATDQMSLLRRGTQETLFYRIAKSDRAMDAGYIISFDVVSDLVQAQRMAAWGDVARRIAHEIKNPLTPIRLSAERIQRVFAPQIIDNKSKFSDLTEIIVRQTEDLRRIVDEFSKFSRMPEAQRLEGDWIKALKQSISLHESSTEIRYSGTTTAAGFFDETLMGQALTNIIKNAIESIEMRVQKGDDTQGVILITGTKSKQSLEIKLVDNGLGLPADKAKLFEPYMTLKETGTGLGLSIVRKIIEEHDGKITLQDRSDGEAGAEVIVKLPLFSALNFHTTSK